MLALIGNSLDMEIITKISSDFTLDWFMFDIYFIIANNRECLLCFSIFCESMKRKVVIRAVTINWYSR